MITLVLASVLISEPRLPVVSKEFAAAFEAHEYVFPDRKGTGTFSALDRDNKGTVPFSSDENRDSPRKARAKTSQSPAHHITYRLFVPRDLKPGGQYPLLLWLHGAGEGGFDNHFNLRYLPLVIKDLKHLEKYRFFILVPQCPSPVVVWTNSWAGTDMLTVTHDLLGKIMREQPVDPDRVYLFGVCSGGSGCWEMAARYPELFAAVVPTTPGCGDVSHAARLVGIPIWAFESDEPELAEDMVAAIQAAGGNIHLTIPFKEHDSWHFALEQCDVMNWMLEQRRGQWICWHPPGCVPGRWWHFWGVPLAFVSIVCLGWYSERQRRRRKADSGKPKAEGRQMQNEN